MRERRYIRLGPLLLAAMFGAAAPVMAQTAEPGELEALQKEIDTTLERQKAGPLYTSDAADALP